MRALQHMLLKNVQHVLKLKLGFMNFLLDANVSLSILGARRVLSPTFQLIYGFSALLKICLIFVTVFPKRNS